MSAFLRDLVSVESPSTEPESQGPVMDLLDDALTDVDTARGSLGAQQNRLTATVSNLSNVVENVSASRSRIRDTDFAAETANLAKNQILQQAGLSVLAQANLSNQGILSLLL